jgi:hypothetical protein
MSIEYYTYYVPRNTTPLCYLVTQTVYNIINYIDFTYNTIIIYPQPWVLFKDVIIFIWPQFCQIRSLALGFDYWNRVDILLRLRQLPYLEEGFFFRKSLAGDIPDTFDTSTGME